MSYLLPEDAYPQGISEEQKKSIDIHLVENLSTIPTNPGKYLDKTGDEWILDSEGRWTDHTGETKPKEWTPIVSIFGPFRKI